jgi:hypothetical protein
MAVGPISYLAYCEWAAREGLDDEQFDEGWYICRRMDGEYLKYKAEPEETK